MRTALKLHPDSVCTATTAIEVEVERPRPDTLMLTYIVAGDPTALRIPPVTAPTRADGLWEHTCFEAFVGTSTGRGYCEFNLAPSTQWAAYRFDDYRHGMDVVEELGVPRIDVRASDMRYTLQTRLQLDRLPELPEDAAWRLGLSAVIEASSGERSYWALAHPPGRADFHHSDCFALELPAA